MLPVKIPRRGTDEEITLSTSFTFALLLLSGGLGPAFIAQNVASVIQDIAATKALVAQRCSMSRSTRSRWPERWS